MARTTCRTALDQAHLHVIAAPQATDVVRQVAIEAVWRTAKRARIDQFPIWDSLLAGSGHGRPE